ncbi:NUDIX domain-containing protein [Herbiconiux sp. SYSU D00978]|uniref:NUDIX domain-containing protein n=1 Tax=Herbiconiux sp. SYSU D00978 TaxID=2812562 RepID=UPI001A95C1F3|nr:NUDIX domain-containing protein [Herbiconiux sp. SYSU D00978]
MQRSAGILLFRRSPGLEVLLGHMGGPYWAGKDEHAWSIPKGLYEEPEQPLDAALREFAEELGQPAPAAAYEPLGEFRVSSGKVLTVFAGEGDADVSSITSNTFRLEWPPRSGRLQQFPELDGAAWFALDAARTKAVKGQLPVLAALEKRLA